MLRFLKMLTYMTILAAASVIKQLTQPDREDRTHSMRFRT